MDFTNITHVVVSLQLSLMQGFIDSHLVVIGPCKKIWDPDWMKCCGVGPTQGLINSASKTNKWAPWYVRASWKSRTTPNVCRSMGDFSFSFSTNTKFLRPRLHRCWLLAMRCKQRVVCVCVFDGFLIKGTHLPRCWVLLQSCTVDLARTPGERAHSSVPPDSRQKGRATSGSCYCGPFVSHHRSRTENGPGGNSTPHPRVSHHPVEVTVTGKLSCLTKTRRNKCHDLISAFTMWSRTSNINFLIYVHVSPLGVLF